MEEEQYSFLFSVGRRECPSNEGELLDLLALNLKKMKMESTPPEDMQAVNNPRSASSISILHA
jgi:hypothetical protein